MYIVHIYRSISKWQEIKDQKVEKANRYRNIESRLGTTGRSFPLSQKRWGDGERPRRMYCMNVIGWLYCINVIKYKNKQKEWHTATKPFYKKKKHRIQREIFFPLKELWETQNRKNKFVQKKNSGYSLFRWNGGLPGRGPWVT